MILQQQDIRQFQIEPPSVGSRLQWLYLVFIKGQILPAPDQGYCWKDLPVSSDKVLQRHVLGQSAHYAFEAVEIAPEATAIEPDMLRSAIMSDQLPGSILLQAGALINWGRHYRFCPRCAHHLSYESRNSERARHCDQCDFRVYPVISPCVITLITRKDEVLLARSHRHPPGFYSLIAGFVEPGENLEQAVAREVLEETGLQVKDIHYQCSQPWPFPHNLMMGFQATYAEGEINVDANELAEADWYPVNNLPRLPPPQTIARQLLDAWSSEKK